VRKTILSLMTVALTVVGSVVVGASPAQAAKVCPTVIVTYNGYQRGYLEAVGWCFESFRDSRGYYLAAQFWVEDTLDEPNETNIVRATIMVAYRNAAGTYHYQEYGPFSAPGDGSTGNGPAEFAEFFEAGGGRHATYQPDYIRITVTAPGKASQVSRFDV
jgi:hypothetical protein